MDQRDTRQPLEQRDTRQPLEQRDTRQPLEQRDTRDTRQPWFMGQEPSPRKNNHQVER